MGRLVRKTSEFLFTFRNASLQSFLLSVYPPGPAVPQIAIRASSPPQMVDQDDIAIIELDPPADQDVSAFEQAEANIQDEQPGNQDNSMAEHPDIRQAGVVSRRDGPAAPYVAFSDDSAEEGNLLSPNTFRL